MSIWESNSVSSDKSHVDLYYEDDGSSGLIYNLYADKLLQLGAVSETVYEVVTAYYGTSDSQYQYGIATSSDDSSSTSLSTSGHLFA